MSASLVGSEMCIRDSLCGTGPKVPAPGYSGRPCCATATSSRTSPLSPASSSSPSCRASATSPRNTCAAPSRGSA
eukprot:4229452-Alexandrium_andersonii.AAC.1